VTIVIVAAGEEWLYRGYAIERLQAVIGNAWIAGGISLCLFTIAHIPLWGFGVALTTLVSGSIFTVLERKAAEKLAVSAEFAAGLATMASSR
jgi:membrane protease YdiL (CAAX protease family)